MIIGGQDFLLPDYLEVDTYRDAITPKLHEFRSKNTIECATEFVLHETAGASDPVATLVKRRLGIHLIVDPSGRIRQHADLLAQVQHIGSHNGFAIGVEVINPYYPSNRPFRGPWELVVDAPWAHALPNTAKQYVVPTRAQAESVAMLCEWMTSRPHQSIKVDWAWPGRVSGGKFLLGPVPDAKPRTGIWAHHHIGGHADGAFLALYSWLRLARGMDAIQAYDQAVQRVTAVRVANISDLV